MAGAHESRDVVLVPAKPPGQGKSRLRTTPPDRRRRLATAFALDTVAAALDTPSVAGVLAITDDAPLAELLERSGCTVVPDGAAGLNATLVAAAAHARDTWSATRVVALLADLPCLTPDALGAVLAALPRDRPAFVRDLHGTGTTTYAAPVELFHPRFGRDSARAHDESGALEIEAGGLRIRLDVDEESDLEAAVALGVGVHTLAALDG